MQTEIPTIPDDISLQRRIIPECDGGRFSGSEGTHVIGTENDPFYG
jgi:hypothetical protein